MTANSSDGVVEADVMRQFLLQCADNYGHHQTSDNLPGEEEDNELRRSSSRMGIGAKIEELRRRERELELEEMLQALDLDQDGRVSLNDFIRLLILDQVEVHEGDSNVEAEEPNESINNDPTGEDKIKSKEVDPVSADENQCNSRTKGCALM